MVNLASIMNFKNGAQGASSVTNAQGTDKGSGGNMLSGIMGGSSYAEKNPMSKELPPPPQLDAGGSTTMENRSVSTSDTLPPKLESRPSGSLGKETEIPDKLNAVGDKPKTITDETYQEAMSRGKYTPAQWLSENAKAAKKGEREPMSLGEYVEVLRDSDNLSETPDERKKREKRESIGKAISGFGNIAANIANFAFATQGAVPGDYNNKAATEREKEIEARRQRLKEKYDDIIMNAKGDDIKYARSLQMAREKAAADKEKDEANLGYRYDDLAFKQKKHEDDQARREKMDAENKRKTDAQIKKWESDAGNSTRRADAAAYAAYNKGKNNKDKYAASFMGSNGTYRFKEKDIASAVASSATAMLKKQASERGDDDTVGAIMDAMAELKSAPAALEFVQQRLTDYPEVEAYIAEQAKKFQSDIVGNGSFGNKEKVNGFGNVGSGKEKPKGW